MRAVENGEREAKPRGVGPDEGGWVMFDLAKRISKRAYNFLGWPGIALIALLLLDILGTLFSIIVAPVAAIPIIDLVTLLCWPFLSLLIYTAIITILFIFFNIFVGQSVRKLLIVRPIIIGISTAIAVAAGAALAMHWNSAVGLSSPVTQKVPRAVIVPVGAEVALVEEGDPRYVRCGSLCLSLLLQGQAGAVVMAAARHEPAPREALPAKRFALTTRTKQCLTGMRDYTFEKEPKDRLREFLSRDGLPTEYDTCFAVTNTSLNPIRQIILTNWQGQNAAHQDGIPGYSASAVIRTSVPTAKRTPLVHEARYRGGWKYDVPLSLWPYAGNAATGSFFSPSVSISYFYEPGFPDILDPRWSKLVEGSEPLGKASAAWLDTVVDRNSLGRE